MTNEEYNQKALEALHSAEKNHMEYMIDIEEKFKQGRKLLPVLNSYGEKIRHDIFNAWSSISISYTMNKDDDWSISRILWQLIEDIDEIIELNWTVSNMNTHNLSIKASGYRDSPYISIDITVYFKDAATCQIEYVEETTTIKKAIVKC